MSDGCVSDLPALQRRTLRVLLFSQLLAGAGLAAGVTVGGLLAEDMLGSTGLSGLPAALLTTGSALAAAGVGRISQRRGRRPGLAAGYVVGALGGLGVVVAAISGSVALLLVSFVLYGSGSATNLQARYAGADLAEPRHRGRAVSTVLVATTFGAVAAPNLARPMGHVADALGIRELAGQFLLSTVAYTLAAVSVLTLLRPDPLLVAREAAATGAGSAPGREAGPEATATADADLGDAVRLRLGIVALIVPQLVMVAIMTMTPIHMREHHHGLGAAGLVISLHIAAMFLPSPLTGILVDRLGRRPLIAASGVTLLAAGVVAAAAPPESVTLLAIALVLLGLGWNLGLVAGTALLTDALPLERRASVQGNVDIAVALAGAGGGLGSGVVVAASSFAALGLAGALVAAALVPVAFLGRRAAPQPG